MAYLLYFNLFSTNVLTERHAYTDDDPLLADPPISVDPAIPSGLSAPPDMISPAVIAKYLQEELKASEIKHCDTCLCASGHRDLTVLADTARSYSVGTQTHLHGDATNSLCLRCNNNLNSPSRTNSPYIMKLVKSSDSVISETKSSYSGSLTGLNAQDKLYSPIKKDDLTVNPILGHHRLCERTTSQMQREAVSVELQIENEIRGLTNKALHLSNGKHTGAAGGGTLIRLQKDRLGNELGREMQNGGDGTTSKTVQIDTASGSTNSLWSKSSSNNNITNADGPKMFETFNRNLIKSIKVSEIECRICLFGLNGKLIDANKSLAYFNVPFHPTIEEGFKVWGNYYFFFRKKYYKCILIDWEPNYLS